MIKNYIFSILLMFLTAVCVLTLVFSESRVETAVGVVLSSITFSVALALILNEKENGERS